MRIMFVCHGNICRSPMAEFIFKKLLCDRRIDGRISVSSSATSDEEIYRGVGNPVYPPAVATLERHGIPYVQRQAVRLRKEDYSDYDLFVGMDSANLRNMRIIFGGDPEEKIKRLKDYSGDGGDVFDPWYSHDFETAYDDIYKGCQALLDSITK